MDKPYSCLDKSNDVFWSFFYNSVQEWGKELILRGWFVADMLNPMFTQTKVDEWKGWELNGGWRWISLFSKIMNHSSVITANSKFQRIWELCDMK